MEHSALTALHLVAMPVIVELFLYPIFVSLSKEQVTGARDSIRLVEFLGLSKPRQAGSMMCRVVPTRRKAARQESIWSAV